MGATHRRSSLWQCVGDARLHQLLPACASSGFVSGSLECGIVVTLKCNHCGAPLTAAADQTVVTCGYCHTSTRIASTRQQRRAEARSHGAPPMRMVGVAIAGVVVIGTIAVFVGAQSRSRTVVTSEPAPSGPLAQASPDEVQTLDEAVPPAVHDAGSAPDAQQSQDVVPPPPAVRGTRPKEGANARVYTGPISTKKDAEQILRPELLACMKEHGVHYLITRLGNERRGANVPPLGLTGTSIVDYKPTPGFAGTPLGRCVARAASAVRAPAYGGDYIYFGLRHDLVPDPLADAPARLDTKAAEQALSGLDDEARDCATRSPAGSRPGESVRIMVFFEGATGQVSKVEPYYVEIKSAYGRCLSSAYRKATVDKFREIDHKVLHVLTP